MRAKRPFRPWVRRTTSYLVPAHPADRIDDRQRDDDDDETIASLLLRQFVPIRAPSLDDEYPHGTYLHGWRDGYAAGFRAGVAHARQRRHRHTSRSPSPFAATSPLDSGLRERSRYHL